jgi:hypothetical protein
MKKLINGVLTHTDPRIDSVPRKRESLKELLLADNVNSPNHYTTGGIETIDFIEAKKLGYNLGNVVKYVSRADYKGRLIEDLRKAEWYLKREIANMEKSK